MTSLSSVRSSSVINLHSLRTHFFLLSACGACSLSTLTPALWAQGRGCRFLLCAHGSWQRVTKPPSLGPHSFTWPHVQTLLSAYHTRTLFQVQCQRFKEEKCRITALQYLPAFKHDAQCPATLLLDSLVLSRCLGYLHKLHQWQYFVPYLQKFLALVF